MGLLDILGLVSSSKGSKEIRKRMLTGRDISTGASNYQINTQGRIKNLETSSSFERVDVEPTENSQTILYKIEELKRMIKGNISAEEKRNIEERIRLLQEKYKELLKRELASRTKNENYR